MTRKTLIRLGGCGIKSIVPIFKTEILAHHSRANFDVKILLGKIIHRLGPFKLKRKTESAHNRLVRER